MQRRSAVGLPLPPPLNSPQPRNLWGEGGQGKPTCPVQGGKGKPAGLPLPPWPTNILGILWGGGKASPRVLKGARPCARRPWATKMDVWTTKMLQMAAVAVRLTSGGRGGSDSPLDPPGYPVVRPKAEPSR